MNNIIIKISENNQKEIPKKTENEIYFYDNLYKKGVKIKGDGLFFASKKEEIIETQDGYISLDDAIEEVMKKAKKENKYVSKHQAKNIIAENCEVIIKYRLFPKGIFKKKLEKSKSSIKNWFDKYLNYNNSSVEILEEFDDSSFFTLDKKDVDDFIDEAERAGFLTEKI